MRMSYVQLAPMHSARATQSRGYPTWFIVPEEIAILIRRWLRARYGDGAP